MTNYLRSLFGCENGNFSVTSALASIPVIMGIGLALDQSQAFRHKTYFQLTLDSAALAIARKGEEIIKDEEVVIARSLLDANYAGDYSDLQVARDGTAITVSAKIMPHRLFSAFFSEEKHQLSLSSTADSGAGGFEIALVLDTTGSMEGGKLTSMKNAVHKLIDQVSANGNVKISVVPFAGFVNVGPQYGPEFGFLGSVTKEAAFWLDANGQAPIPQSDLPEDFGRFALFNHLGTTWPGCVETRLEIGGNDYGLDDTPPDPDKPETLFTPMFAIDEPDDANRYPNSYLDDMGLEAGSGSAADRLARYGATTYTRPTNLLELIRLILNWNSVTQDNSPSTFYSDGSFPKGPGFGCEVDPLLELTGDLDEVRNKIGSLEANGGTNTAEGVMWGWRVLSPGEPFTQGAVKNSGIRKTMIVLSDGKNVFGTQSNKFGSSYTSYGYLVDGRLGITAGGSSTVNDLLNRRTAAACENAKADGIEIYTIKLEETDSATGTMLENCASSPSHYFDATSRNQLDGIFNNIGTDLQRIRIAS